MNLNAGEKWLKSALLIYLILAIIGSLALSTGQDFSHKKTNKDNTGSSGYFSSIVLTVDWLAEDTPAISKTHRYTNAALRNGLLRVFMLTGIIGITLFLAKSNLKKIKNDNFPIIKNLVPLKLRI